MVLNKQNWSTATGDCDRGAWLISPHGVGCQSGVMSGAPGHSKGEGREAKAPLPPWPQHHRCGWTQSSSLPNVDTSAQEVAMVELAHGLTPLAISQVWKYQLFCWEEKKTSPGPKPSCGSYCFYSPTLTRTLQLSFGPIASGKLLPLKAIHGPETKSVPPLKPPLNAGAWRAPLPSSLQSNRPPALVPSDHSSVFFAASSFSAHLLLFSLYLGIH